MLYRRFKIEYLTRFSLCSSLPVKSSRNKIFSNCARFCWPRHDIRQNGPRTPLI